MKGFTLVFISFAMLAGTAAAQPAAGSAATDTPPPPAPAPEAAPTPTPPPTPTPAPVPVVEPAPAPHEPTVDVNAPKVELKLGGFVMGAAYYDTNNNITRPWLVRVNAKDGDRSLDIDPLPTRLSLTATTKYKGKEAKGYVEGDLKVGDIARIRQAYASVGGPWGSVLVGQTYTLVGGFQFIDSYNIDAYFAQGGGWTRQPQIRFTHKAGDLQFHVAALTARGMGNVVVASGAVGAGAVVDLPELPFVQARVEYTVMKKGMIALAGSVGQFQVAFTPTMGMMSPLAAFKKKLTGGMAAVDVVLPFGKHKLVAHGFYSQSGGNSTAVQQAVEMDKDGSLHRITSMGGFINAVLALGDGARLSLWTTVDNPTDHAGTINLPVERNLVYGGLIGKEILPKVETGIDIEYAETKTQAAKLDDLRTTIAIKYSL